MPVTALNRGWEAYFHARVTTISAFEPSSAFRKDTLSSPSLPDVDSTRLVVVARCGFVALRKTFSSGCVVQTSTLSCAGAACPTASNSNAAGVLTRPASRTPAHNPPASSAEDGRRIRTARPVPTHGYIENDEKRVAVHPPPRQVPRSDGLVQR